MKVLDVVQGSQEWLAARAGIPTASELDNLISPTGKIRTGEMPKTYLCRKLAERWTGGPLQTFVGGAMEQGSILEGEALPWYELQYECTLNRPGFLLTDDERFGCSPDALADSYGLEIKCPEPINHLKWLMGDECPPEHYLQCQGGMYVTGLNEWRFVSYRRGFPHFVVSVPRDNELMLVIEDALAKFSGAMSIEFDRLCEMNGGPPQRRAEPIQLPDVPMIGLETDLPPATSPDFEVIR